MDQAEWWFLFSRTTQKSGNLSVQSAATTTAVTQKSKKHVKISYDTSILGFEIEISKMGSVFVLG